MSGSFCSGEPFWDTDPVWHNANPQFSNCFLKTLPIWIPAAFLWLTGLPQVFYIYQKRRNSKGNVPKRIPFNWYNTIRLLLVAAIVVTNIVKLIVDSIDAKNDTPSRTADWAALSASIIQIITFAFLGFLLNLHRTSGYHTSAIVWFFAFGSVIASLPSLYTFSMFYKSPESVWYLKATALAFFSLHFAFLVLFFILSCLADKRNDKRHIFLVNGNGVPNGVPNGNVAQTKSAAPKLETSLKSKVAPKESPDQSASFLSLLTFWWLNALCWVGFKKSLTLEDLADLSPEHCTESLAKRYDVKWENRVRSGKEPGVLRLIGATFLWSLLAGAILKLATDMMQFANPQLQKIFIAFIQAPDASEPIWHGFFLAAMFFIVSTCGSFFSNHYFTVMNRLGMQLKTALISAIYRKSLKLSNKTRRETTSGEIINLMAVDVQRLAMYMPYFNLIWADPIIIIVSLYFLWIELGPSVLAGFAIMILMIPLNATTTTYQGRFQNRQMAKKDERVKVINELLSGIRVIKLYGWEVPFISKVSTIRAGEVAELKKMAYLNGVGYIMWTVAPFLVSLVTFTAYLLSSEENILDAQKAFVSLSLFEMLRLPLNTLPEMITQLVMAMVSIRRLDRFLSSSELDLYVGREEAKEAITIKDGTFAWDQKESLTLSSVNLSVPKGSLVAIVGQVGSGKSSLLSAILGDMEAVSGSVNVNGSSSIAYVAQQAWIRNSTLRENILFGKAYNGSRYRSVIEMCALKPDLAILPGGDQVEIGEKGINLSGGQKQRVAIARACYDSADIVLLDDPLSAVDSHVAKHLFTQVLSSKTGFLKDRTRVLATNNISILPDVDQIVVLVNGTISEIGSYKELMASSGKFADFVREHREEAKNAEEPVEVASEAPRKTTLRSESLISESSGRSSLRRRTHRSSTIGSALDFDPLDELPGEEENQQQLIKTETAETGRVKWNNYLIYFKSYTYFWCAVILFGFVAKQFSAIGSNLWLAEWSSDKLTGVNGTQGEEDIQLRNKRLGVYAALGCSQAICIAIGSLSMAIATVKSSSTFHRRLFDRIMRSPMRFFDTTPLGRIVNRFSKDIDTIDSAIPLSLQGLIFCMLEVVATIIFIAFQVPIYIAAVVPALVLYYFIQKFYLSTSRQLKRLESITRSPIYSHFGETLSGCATIRAYGLSSQFIRESNSRVDTNQRCYFPNFIANRWLALRLEFCGNLITLAAAIFAVLSREAFRDNPGIVGLIITYSFTVTLNLNWMVRMTSEMETNVVSVERIDEYCQVETEGEWTRPGNEEPVIPTGWPVKGDITFRDYSVRYREGLDLVLDGVTLDIQAGEKIGIVGRTGSGKSTLTLALFRILEASLGRIEIDGLEIGKLGLHELRGILSIIPQDPVLFSGSIRSNLDPFSVYTDEQLWEALRHSHLKEYIASLETGLEYTVAENGENLSIGQRQLICLGRALLRKTKILVLDEATAAIDLTTDALIQETIRSEFAACTILTIAHRLNTIMDSSRVLVMDAGKVAEFDTPANLLAKKETGAFYSLAKDAGLV